MLKNSLSQKISPSRQRTRSKISDTFPVVPINGATADLRYRRQRNTEQHWAFHEHVAWSLPMICRSGWNVWLPVKYYIPKAWAKLTAKLKSEGKKAEKTQKKTATDRIIIAQSDFYKNWTTLKMKAELSRIHPDGNKHLLQNDVRVGIFLHLHCFLYLDHDLDPLFRRHLNECGRGILCSTEEHFGEHGLHHVFDFTGIIYRRYYFTDKLFPQKTKRAIFQQAVSIY